MPPVTTGADQVYVVPAGCPAGVTENVPPLQMVDVCAVTDGTGLTVTVTVKVEPVQVAVAGVTVYVAVWAVVVGFVRVWLILVCPVP